MKTIWKYPLQDEGHHGPEVILDMPEGARVLCVQVQHGLPCLWALVDPEAPVRPRHFLIRGTGHPVQDDVLQVARHIGTVQLLDGQLVFHVFEHLGT